MIPIARPNLGTEEENAVLDVLRSGILTRGPKTKEFEERFAEYIGRKYAIAVSSGTAALHISLLALGVSSGDEVVIPPLTFFATASTTIFCGGVPVFVDIDPDIYTLDPARLESCLTDKTKVVLPVDIYGQPADMDEIIDIAEKKRIAVLEDACQAHGSEYRDKKAGAFGDVSCFSFYATKNMTTGEGGMILTDDDVLAEKCRLLREHGERGHYNHVSMGYNYRMNEVAAAIGIEQLKKLDSFVRIRQENAEYVTNALRRVDGIVPPTVGSHRSHSFYQYIIRVENDFPLTRDALIDHLREEGISARESYPIPLYSQPILKDRVRKYPCPVTERVIPKMLELPIHPLVEKKSLEKIARAISQCAA